MKPYIFLSNNYLKTTVDENAAALDIRELSALTPYEQIIYFTDRYGNVVEREIDTLILRNTNIVNMTVEVVTQESESESGSESGEGTALFTLSGNTESDVFLKAAEPITASCIRISIPNDGENPATATAQIGVYSFLCNLWALTDSNYKIDANEGAYRVISGAYIHWADYKKWFAKLGIENLPQEQFNLLTEQADTGEMTVIPYQDLAFEEVYECAVKRQYSYELNRKTALFSLELEFNEL